MSKTAIIAGSTGLVGNEVLKLLLADNGYNKVIAITRKPLELKNEKLVNLVIEFSALGSIADQLKGDDVFCCLGTTMKKAVTKKKFTEVDYDYPLKLAEITKQQGASQYLLISALGADTKSSVFYNRVKGQVEVAIEEVGFRVLHILRPSLLLGPREEERIGEDAAKTFFKVFGFLFNKGPLKKYKAIKHIKVAQAMALLAQSDAAGTHTYESMELFKLVDA